MYVNDYRYAADPTEENAWSNLASNYYYLTIANNWMYMGLDEWTISRYSDDKVHAFFVDYSGCVTNTSTFYGNMVWSVRPCFYLKSTVEFSSGTGTQSDPYRLA